MEISGRRITVMGLGRHGGGVSAARWLAGEGALVTVTDSADVQTLATSISALADVQISRWCLGRHDESDFTAAEAVVVNPAVRPDHPLLAVARQCGVPITSEIELFLDRCRGTVIGVTGSNGKSTTATMLATILAASGQKTWLGGNIGLSLLGELSAIGTTDRVVLELSSFQLAHLSKRARSPMAAVVTNCTPNHLDWHGSPPAYAAAKRRLVDGLPADGFVVLNPTDPQSWTWRHGLRSKVVAPVPAEQIPQLAVRGEHNRLNAALAAAAAVELGVSAAAIATSLGQFTGLAHRCQAIGEAGGRRIIDDSKSTTPEATLSALASCTGRVWLLLGGQDKGADFEPLLSQVVRQAAGAACFGFVGSRLQAGLARLSATFPCCAVADLPAAFSWCWKNSEPGDTILLSPACASLDQFRDFVHRAEEFRALAAAKRQALDC